MDLKKSRNVICLFTYWTDDQEREDAALGCSKVTSGKACLNPFMCCFSCTSKESLRCHNSSWPCILAKRAARFGLHVVPLPEGKSNYDDPEYHDPEPGPGCLNTPETRRKGGVA